MRVYIGKHGCDVSDLRVFLRIDFIKAKEHFCVLHSLILKLGGLGEFSKVMETRDVVEGLHNCLEFSQYQPSSCLDEAT